MLFYTFTCQTNTNTTYIWPDAVFEGLPIIQTETFFVGKDVNRKHSTLNLSAKLKDCIF